MPKQQTKPTLEQSFEQLEDVIGKMEADELSLEDSFEMYQKGMKLLQDCNKAIDKVEKKLVILNENGENDGFSE